MAIVGKLLIVILNYKVTDLTIDCLRSLHEEVTSSDGFGVAVLENGTGEADYQRLSRFVRDNLWDSWINLSKVMPNRGFCGGNNVILRQALALQPPPQYIMLLNADTIVRPRALAELVDFMDRHPQAGIAGSRLLSPEGKDQSPAFRFPTVAGEFAGALSIGPISKLFDPYMGVPPHPGRTTKVEWVPGAAMILRSKMLQQIGPLDEDLYTYFDDIDICQRAARAGWETWYVHESEVVHLEGASTGIGTRLIKRRPDYWFEARRRCNLNNYGSMKAALLDAAFIVGFAGRRFRRWILREEDSDPPHMLGDFIRHSVWVTGFKIKPVVNPALAQTPRA
ncbi:MAG: glycosyltransferase family 2 protein [Hyphomicrobiales bacterium]